MVGDVSGKNYFRVAVFVGKIILLLTFSSGCATSHADKEISSAKISALKKNLRALSPAVDATEAQRAAETCVVYPLQLAQDWRVTPPAIFNNTLINVGLHQRGLCYQWADALTIKLLTLHLQTLVLHRGVAKLGTRREHSCVVLTAPGQDFTNGIALDAWRDCGKINFSPVTADKYAWQEVTLVPDYEIELQTEAEKMERGSKQP